MITRTFNQVQFNELKLSEQVEKILFDFGYSHIFNLADFKQFKKVCKDEFNQAYAIARLFIQENDDQVSDYSEYIY
nr:hypothetical protein [uncultured Flavobacterium sp.]